MPMPMGIAGSSMKMRAVPSVSSPPALALLRELVQQHGGHAVGSRGDSLLAEFPSVVAAVQCAIEMQHELPAKNTDLPENKRIAFRIGISLGEIVIDGDQPHGDGINIAVRIEGLAEPGEICLSEIAYQQVKNKLSLQYDDLGPQQLKNIPEPVRVYRIILNEAAWAIVEAAQQTRRQTQQVSTSQRSRIRPVFVSVLVFVVLLGGLATFWALFPAAFRTPHSELRTEEAQPPSLPLPDKPSIVVLPFANMSADPNQDYLGDAIAEDITTDLSKLSGLFVISRYSAFTYKGKDVKVQDVGRELGVRYVLEGSVRRVDDEVRVTAQLIDATTGYHLWSERYSRALKNILALQDEVVRKIVVHLALRLTDIEIEQLERAYPVNIEAYEYQHRGMEHLFRVTKDDVAQARQLCEKAIALEPTYAPAYYCAGWTYWGEWVNQWTQDPQTLERALELGQKAIALDDSLTLAHELVGAIYLWKRRYEQSIAELERSLAVAPNWGSSYATLGIALNATGRAEEAIGVLEKALRLNPRNPIHTANYLTALGQAYRLTGRYDEAITTLKKALGLFPKHLGAHWNLAVIYDALGREAEAQAEVAEILQINPKFSLDGLQQRLLFKDPAENERILAALRKAGLR
jgi:adenylate cyclase